MKLMRLIYFESYLLDLIYQSRRFSAEKYNELTMILHRKLCFVSKNWINLIKNQQINNQAYKNLDQCFVKMNLTNTKINYFSTQNKNTVPPNNFKQKGNEIQEIRQKIENMYLKLNQHEELNQLEKIVYPEALLHGQQNVSKLSKLYDLLIFRFQRQNIDRKGVQDLIKAGDFYRKMSVRRLKALKPYERAKHIMQTQNLHKTSEGQKTYKQLCEKLSSLIQQDINKGECSTVQQYYKKGLEQEKSQNQLQSLYYYHKGLCISQHQQIPDKLLHFNLMAHYVFLSELMRPKCNKLKESQQFDESLEKHEELEKLSQKWWKEDFSNQKDNDKIKAFHQTRIWALANKADIYYRAHKYSQASKCYQKVIDFYKQCKTPDQRLKIIKVIQHLQKSYEHLGLNNKAVTFLEWAHDFVKDQTSNNVILKSRYLKPIDQMLIDLYQKCKQWGNGDSYGKRKDIIEKELKEIVS